ncbi:MULTISPECIES: TetR family transcriptional regulator [unclassified Rathayibacter]|uniref:TetR family transcriptional regulator n=1 Tax=unclassified Rathayibacter TaxID=2609250 RepID=UPI000700566C|nr:MULTISPECIES: TetR family transcriptional regulator [unclassified Rathayibacter]KQQ03620.1 TetR family transcriptional regulator [Rathayibacter sp. Leaf294]KQS12076.1 TetR family transcriptional regulator [Rathayibacter sp. Leaf185]
MTDARDTRLRILAAATEEFARHGIAGARVDRVAQRSGMSKPMIYTYFSSKEGLFDAVFETHVVANSDRVPFDVEDLPGYAVRLYNDYLADPALLRLVMWKRLERIETGYLFAGHEAHDAAHVARISDAQKAGRVRRDLEPQDVWSILIATAATWAQSSITAVASSEEPEEQHVRRRLALAAVVRDGLLAG